ncbi:MAG: 4-hydroxy-tetrahydrodipicolinate synthase [Lachnospiraceae bacterium]|nr:4-hydroxy-tetrahydrodipicolinate synthase [Lachnospiraceae bacterium]
MAIFEGAGVAIVTPMKENGEVNFDKLGEIIDFQIENGTDSIIICGTTGEASTLSHEEHSECIRYTVAHVKGRVPVIAGTGSNCTETAVHLSKQARDDGADGLLLVTPYYNKATQKGLIQHFTTIAASVDIPVILYNVPGRTGCNIQPETAAYLAKNVENIVAMKEATGNISQAIQTVLLCEGALDLYSGNDESIVPILSIGGKGVISVLSNVAPRETHDIVAKYLAGDTQGSLALQLKYLPLVRALFSEVNPIPVKAAMNMMGLNVGPLRAPLTEMEEAHAQVLRAELQKVGLIA